MLFKLHGTFQHYEWGGEHFIPQWMKLSSPLAKPYAEYWLGAHHASPSMVEFERHTLPLDVLLAQESELLGQKSRDQFGAELPFLLKILDVKQPLSIQLHPTKPQAEQGFEQENQAGIALNAPNRTYKDRNHKPEMMIALSDFWLLHGFKPQAQIQQSLRQHECLQPLGEKLQMHGIASLYAHIMQAEQAQLAAWILPIVEAKQADFVAEKLALSDPDYWLLYTMEAMSITREKLDAGLLCFYLFNLVHVKKGQGIYQGAGLPHAYLRGQCIELMAASDNVIRGGLTPKYVNIPALLDTVDYQEIVPECIPAADFSSSDCHHYPTPKAKDFALQHLAFKAFDETAMAFENAAILLVMAGGLRVILNNEVLTLAQGEAVFISAESEISFVGEEEGDAVIATLP